jgi:hypothetical protein
MLGNPFLITLLLDLLSLPFSFLDHHTDHPTAMMLGSYSMSASLIPSEFFYRRFDLSKARFL